MPGVTQRHLGLTRGGPPMAQAASWRGLPPGRAHKAPGAHRPHLQVILLPLSLSFFPNRRVLALELAFLLFLEVIFDLSPQPIIWAEILRKYFLVCNSSTPPIRFLIGGFICVYLVVLGAVHMSLHGCAKFYFQVLMQVCALGKWVD